MESPALKPKYKVSVSRHGAVDYDNVAEGYPNHPTALENLLGSELIQEQWEMQFKDPIRVENDDLVNADKSIQDFVSVYWKHFGRPSFVLRRDEDLGSFKYAESMEEPLLWQTSVRLLPVAKYTHADGVLVIGASNAGKSSLCNFLMNPYLNCGVMETPSEVSSYWCYASSYLPRTGTTMQIVNIYADQRKEFYDPRYVLGPTSKDSILCLLDAPGWADDRYLSSYFGATDKIPEILGGTAGNLITIDQVHMINTVKGLQDNRIRYVSAIVLVITADELSDKSKDAESWTKILTQLSTYRNVLSKAGCLHMVVTKSQTVNNQPGVLWARLTTFLDKLNVLLQVMLMGDVKIYPFIINTYATGDEWFYTVSQAQRLLAQLRLCKSMCKPESIRVYKEPELTDVHLAKCRELIEDVDQSLSSYYTTLHEIKKQDVTSSPSKEKGMRRQSSRLERHVDNLDMDNECLCSQLGRVMSDLKQTSRDAISRIKVLTEKLSPKIAVVLFLGVETDADETGLKRYKLVAYDTIRRKLLDIGDQVISPSDQKKILAPSGCEFAKHSTLRSKVLDNTTEFKQIAITPQCINLYFSAVENMDDRAGREAMEALGTAKSSISKLFEICKSIARTHESLSDASQLFPEIVDDCKTLISAGSKKKNRKEVLSGMSERVHDVAEKSKCIGPNTALCSTVGRWKDSDKFNISDITNCINDVISMCNLLENGASGVRIGAKINLPCLGEDEMIMDKRFVDVYTVSALVPCFMKTELHVLREEVKTELDKIRGFAREATNIVRNMGTSVQNMNEQLEHAKKLINSDIHVYLYKAFVNPQQAARVGDIQATASPAVGDLSVELRVNEAEKSLRKIQESIPNYKDTLSVLRREYLATNNDMDKMTALHEKGFVLNPMCPPPTVVESKKEVDLKKDARFKESLEIWNETMSIRMQDEEASKHAGGAPPIHKATYNKVVKLREQIGLLEAGRGIAAELTPDLKKHVETVKEVHMNLKDAASQCQMECRALRDVSESFPDLAAVTNFEEKVILDFLNEVNEFLVGMAGYGQQEEKKEEL